MTVTPDQSDSSLLQEFAARHSQDAFTELVSRHSDWVYSAALRMVRDRHLAEDVAQAVFLILADKAARLSAAPLHSWLFKVTRYASANAIRARARRDKYERRAAMASSETHDPNPDQMWRDISPILDDSINSLRSKDRDALLMRFYQQKNLAEVGAALGVSEGAAKVRVARAVEKLRGILRRKGVSAPADALGIALIAHTTHAAPAIFAKGFVPAAASIKAGVISKGVSTMMVSTKIKIAAAILIIGSIPIGAGAYYLVSSRQPAAAVNQQTVAQAPPAEEPQVAQSTAAVEPPAAVNPYPGIDPRVEPFVTDRTDLLIAIDLTKLNLDAIAADLRGELNKSQTNPQAVGQLNGIIQMGVGTGKQWIGNFEKAGGTSMYLMSRADELVGTGSTGMKLSATVVFPTDSPAAAQTLARFFRSSGSRVSVVGNAVVDATSTPYAPHIAPRPDPRPALSEGLLACGDNAVRLSMNPLELKPVMSKLMASGQLTPSFAGDEWNGIQYVSMELVLPPADATGLLITSHYKDAASAEIAKDRAVSRIANTFKSQAESKSAITRSMIQFVSTETFSVKDRDVIARMDLHRYYDLLFTAMQGAMQPPSTRPHKAAN
ncbi:MAG TPA: sigma-70 family RNA polymerase sigma factor [Tepidisphaeraceae bacterium]|jgi:RNA polymerase sigma factor (sigma-70 family)